METRPLLSMKGITKTFPGVRALDGVDLQAWPGEIHALMGENGAGKSTLMKVLGGVHVPDGGEMELGGRPYVPRSPRDAQAAGIGFIHQELNLVGEMTVAENILLGRFPRRCGLVDYAALRREAQRALEWLEVDLPLGAPVRSLNVGQQQMVEIARALVTDRRLLILDEPTAALSEKEAGHLFGVIGRLREQGTALLYISHRMEEVFQLADRITVLRDGARVGTWPASQVSREELVRAMVGREISEQFPERRPRMGEELLRVEGLSREGVIHQVSFSVRAGEIVGLAGLVGAGRTEIARSLIGADPMDSGTVYLEGEPVAIRSPRDAIRLGLGYVTEDRKGQGLVLGMTVEENATLASLQELCRGPFLDTGERRRLARRFVEELAIRTAGLGQVVATLSGGNQQKVVIARWLARNCRVLILDEPTRGVDVGAKAEIYRIIEHLSAGGAGILLISSELPELLGLSDRILVIHQGRIAGEFSREEADPEKVIHCALTGEAA